MDGIALGSLGDLVHFKPFKAGRVASWDVSGRNRDAWPIEPGERKVLADIEGPGVISHIWFTIACEDKHYLRKLVLRCWWDGEDDPSVETPVGDFFGVGHGWVANFECCALNMSTSRQQFGGRAAMNCFFPMPFRKHARIEIENPCEVPVRAFYFYIDYQVWKELPEVAQFHAKWRRENPCDGWQGEGSTWHSPDWQRRMRGEDGVNLTGDDNYLILDAKGRGHYVGTVLSIHNLYQGWWGEGDDMMFVDGEGWPPSLHGTGTEDYFCHAWGMQDNRYLYNGTSLWVEPNQNWRGQWTVYRFHVPDPVPFEKSIRVSIEHGHANNRSDDYSSVAYWYQTEPHKNWAPFAPVEKRLGNV